MREHPHRTETLEQLLLEVHRCRQERLDALRALDRVQLEQADMRALSLAIDTLMAGGSYYRLVAEGKTATDIRDILYISARTVEKHRSNLMKKLGLKSHAEVIRFALQRGLIPILGPGGSTD